MTDLDRLDALAEKATRPDWNVCPPEATAMHRMVVGEDSCPADARIIDRPPQSKKESMETFFEAVMVGYMSEADMVYVAALVNAYPSLSRELREARAKLDFFVSKLQEEVRENEERRAIEMKLDADNAALRAEVERLYGQFPACPGYPSRL